MKVYEEISIREFEGWSGAEETIDKIVEAGKEEEFESFIEASYPDGIDKTELNDLLRFDSDWVFEMLGIEEEDEDEDWDKDLDDDDEEE